LILGLPRDTVLIFAVVGVIVIGQLAVNAAKPWIDRLLYPEDREENPGSINSSILHFCFLLRDKTAFIEQQEILNKIIGETPTVTQKILLLIAEARRAWLNQDYDLALARYKELLETLQPLGDHFRNGSFHEETADMLLERSASNDPALARDFLEKAIAEYREAGLPFYENIASNKLETLTDKTT
jgi:hypothetical protein